MQILTLNETYQVSGHGLTKGLGALGGVLGSFYGLQIGHALGAGAFVGASNAGSSAMTCFLFYGGCLIAPTIAFAAGGAIVGCTVGIVTESIINVFS